MIDAVQKLIIDLEAFVPYDEAEKRDRQLTLDFIKRTPAPDAFLRANIEGHITASAWLLSSDLSEVLLNHHGYLDKWIQFGGHADGNPNLLEEAIRETIEESGIESIEALQSTIFDIDVQAIPENPKRNEGSHTHYDVRYLLKARDKDFKISDKSHGLKWVGLDDIFSMPLQASVLRMAQKWKDYVDGKR